MKRLPSVRRKPRRWLTRYPRLAPIIIFILTMTITVISVLAIERAERARGRATLAQASDAIQSALERRSNANSAYLRAGAALFGMLDTVTPAQFRRFVGELRLDADQRGAEGIGWAAVIAPAQAAAYERRMRALGWAGFAIRPAIGAAAAGPRRQMVPVTYLLPDSMRNRRAIGFDMFSEPRRRAAMNAAAQGGRPAATDHLVLVQEGAQQAPGFIVYMPVYGQNGGQRTLRGFIYSPFNGQDFLRSALELDAPRDVAVRLYNGGSGEGALIAATRTDTRLPESISRQVTIANHPMILEVRAVGQATLSQLSLLTLLFGLLLASLLMIVARLITQQAREDETTIAYFEEQHSIRNSLTRELNHRVKNTLANVLSIVALTRRRATDVDAFAEGVDGRIRALSATHDLLTQSEWGTTPIGAVIGAELATYLGDDVHAVTLTGPDVELAPNDALSLGLAIHELATNAAKYGSLSVAGGLLAIHWLRCGDGLAEIVWRETGGPPVPQERTRGFGTELIEKIVAHELRNPVDLRFEPSGVYCRLTVPVRDRGEFMMRARPR